MLTHRDEKVQVTYNPSLLRDCLQHFCGHFVSALLVHSHRHSHMYILRNEIMACVFTMNAFVLLLLRVECGSTEHVYH